LFRKADAAALGTIRRRSDTRSPPLTAQRAGDERLERCRLVDRPRDHVERRDRDRRRIAEPSEGLCGCDDAHDEEEDQRADHAHHGGGKITDQRDDQKGHHAQRHPGLPLHAVPSRRRSSWASIGAARRH
jgi:hypothetical protein